MLKCRRRFLSRRLHGLHDDPRPAVERTITDEQVEMVVVKTLESYLWALPEEVPASVVVQDIGSSWTCPWCHRAVASRLSKRHSPADSDTWVRLPFGRTGRHWVCIECAIDVYTACLSSDFQNCPDHALIVDLAAVEHVSVEQFRQICLNHQMTIIQGFSDPIDIRASANLLQRVTAILDALNTPKD